MMRELEKNQDFTFYYFELYVRGDAIRAMLNHAGAKYEDKYVTFDEWKNLKPNAPNGKVPYIEFAYVKKFGESFDITRALGKNYGYYPEKAEECEKLLKMYAPVIDKIYKPHFPKYEA